jgi:hypothetical protein
MATITFDTLAYAKRLKAVGNSSPQAEAMSDAFKEAQQSSNTELATKADIQAVRFEIQQVKSDMKLYFLILLFVIILTNPNSLELISKILGITK